MWKDTSMSCWNNIGRLSFIMSSHKKSSVPSHKSWFRYILDIFATFHRWDGVQGDLLSCFFLMLRGVINVHCKESVSFCLLALLYRLEVTHCIIARRIDRRWRMAGMKSDKYQKEAERETERQRESKENGTAVSCMVHVKLLAAEC